MPSSAPVDTTLVAEARRMGYSVQGRLAVGASSEIHDVRHDASGRRLAMKVSRLDVADVSAVGDRIRTELNVGRTLRHRHIVEIYEGGLIPDGRAWLVMERLRGHDLMRELEQHGALSPTRALHIARQICGALVALHRRGAVHRDIKPDNLFLVADGRFADHIKLIDLGIVSLPENDPGRAHAPTGHFIMGTPLYLSPEQAHGHTADPRTDLYAVGGVLYHMLAGQPPFQGQDPKDLVVQQVRNSAQPLELLAPDLPAPLVALVHRCLAKNRDERPQSAGALIDALDTCADALTSGFVTVVPPERAPLPQIPHPGKRDEWRRLGAHLERLSHAFWSNRPPAPLAAAIEAVGDAREVLREAELDAERRRDLSKLRIALHRERRAHAKGQLQVLASRHPELEAHLKRAHQLVRLALETLSGHEARYAREAIRLAQLTASTVHGTSLGRLRGQLGRVDGMLRDRAPLGQQLSASRTRERTAGEALATLRADEIELQRQLAEATRQSQTEGFSLVQAANTAAEDLARVERAHERVVLRLLLRYAEAVRALDARRPPTAGVKPVLPQNATPLLSRMGRR